MRLWCRPGITFELGRMKVLVAPAEQMASLLEVPEIAMFHALYLYAGLSEVLFRVPPIRSEHFEAVACGQRSGTVPAELYQSGFYVQSAQLVDCHTERSRKAGFLCENQEAGGLTLIESSDTGSAYSLVVEYGGNGAKVEIFVSDSATRRLILRSSTSPARAGRCCLGSPSGWSTWTRPRTLRT